jgi:hypothetical protein
MAELFDQGIFFSEASFAWHERMLVVESSVKPALLRARPFGLSGLDPASPPTATGFTDFV